MSKVHVVVSKAGTNGRPQAQVFVDPKISASNLSSLVQKVVTNEAVLRVGGLGACLGCKSGMDVNILDLGGVVEVEV